MKKIVTLLISIFTISRPLFAEAPKEGTLVDRLNIRNDLFMTTQKVYKYLFDDAVLNRLDAWVTHQGNEEYIVPCQFSLRPIFQSPKILAPLCYFLRQDDFKKRELYYDFVKLYIQEQKATVFELMEDPRYDETLREKARKYYDKFDSLNEENLQRCFKIALKTSYTEGINSVPFSGISTCLINNFTDPFNKTLSFIGVNPQKEFCNHPEKGFCNHPGRVISPTGWIPGNKISYFYFNEDKNKDYFEKNYKKMVSLYKLSGLEARGSYEKMVEEDLNNIFTADEGFEDVTTHPVWSQKSPSIYGEILDGINKAQETIFVDIFFLGGTMGASLAKHFVKLLNDKPNLKIFILRDLNNHFGHADEMLPVFNFLKAYSYKNPSRLIISKSHITSHISGLPDFMKDILDEDFVKATGLNEHTSLYPSVKSDHSKVIVIDGKTANRVAFVGSKNWTDSSGAICYDEVVKIEGPAAAVVQDDYYYDMFYALTREFKLKEEKDDSWLDRFLVNGWAKYQGTTNISREKKASLILQPFDLLNRDDLFKPNLDNTTDLELSKPGTTILRTGYNNVDSSHNNALEQVVQLILSAKERIFIKDQYLFDRNVVLALLKVKEANPGIDIRILLEPLDGAPIPGMPNLMYADVLTKAGIKIRFKHVFELKKGEHIAQEYHMKTISADRKFVISGSANKDQTTMYGSFREEQVEIYGEEIAKIHDDVFINHWDNSSTPDFVDFTFPVPAGVKGLDGNTLTQPEFISLLRDLISILFDAKMF